MLELAEQIASADFAQIARHPEFPQAFTRHRKLPLLDGFFASVHPPGG